MGDVRLDFIPRCCGCEGPSPLGYDLCDTCNAAEETEWPVSLGLSIRRFVRRAEVEGLVDTAKRFACYAEADAALDRLAALAMGGDDD